MDKKPSLIMLALLAFTLPIAWYLSGIGPIPSLHETETIRSISLLDQIVVVFTAFVMKPLYMLISLILVWLIRKSRDPNLVALRWGLLAFFTGEAFCAINYLIFQDQSYLAEYFHNFGMVASFGFIGYALLEGLDRHVIQYSDPQKRCALIGLCGSCIKTQAVSCRIHKLFQLTALTLGLLTFIPLLVKVSEISYNANIFDTLYNYTWLKVDQLFELRYCPLLALVMFISAFLITLRSKVTSIPALAKIFLSAGVGALGFGLFRLFLNSIYLQNLAWADSWEEITEFLLMIIISYILYLFRQRLDINIGQQEIATTNASH
jgi:hypothetical protein